MAELNEIRTPATPADPGTPGATPTALPVWEWRTATTPGTGPAVGTAAPQTAAARAAAARAARREGAIGGAVGLTVAAVLAFVLGRRGMGLTVAAIAVLVAATALAAPLTLYHGLRRGLDRFASWVGTAVTWVAMTVIFYLLFLPVGLILRAMGKLSFTRFAEPSRTSYWTPTDDRPHAADSYRKQF